VRGSPAHDRDDERRPCQAGALERDLLGGGLRVFAPKSRDDAPPAASRASPSNTMKRQGTNLL
jgi:hypothetical protein